MTYNTWLLPQLRWPPLPIVRRHLHADQRARAPLLAASVPAEIDICVFQEVFDKPARKALLDGLLHHPHQTPVLAPPTSGWRRVLPGGVVICSRHPIVAHQQVIFEAQTGLDGYLTKGAVYAAIAPPTGPRIHVVGLHLQAHNGAARDAIRRQQLRQIRRLINGVGALPHEPVLIVGDFNICHSDHEQRTRMLTLLDATIPYAVDDTQPTYDPSTNALCRETNAEYLDYVLVHRDGGATTGVATLFQPKARFAGASEGRPLSDHYGVIADFSDW